MNPVGRYQIESEIGRGAMGVVFKALDPAIGRTVAIKTIHLTDITDPDIRQRTGEQLFREAKAAGTLLHPNIVMVFDVLEQNEFAYIVMEYIAGSSLEELMHRGRTPSRDDLVDYLRQIAQALDYAHRRGIIHRDVKPGNILIADGSSLAKITDFGIAKTIATDATNPGRLIGTPSYMSPEQIEGSNLDGRTDQYSLAVVIYELLSGKKPFSADTLPALLHKICSEQARPIEEINHALNPTVGKVLGRALAKKPEDRFETTSDFIGALSVALTRSFNAPSPAIGPALTDLPATDSGFGTAFHATLFNTELGSSTMQSSRRSRTLPFIVLLCFAVAAAIVFIVRLNAPPEAPVEVLEKSSRGPSAARPQTQPQPQSEPEAKPPPSSGASASKPGTSLSTSTAATKPPKTATQATVPKPGAEEGAGATASVTPPETAHPRGVIVPAMPAAETGMSTSDIDLVTEPAGAKITVDGRADAVCNAPCTMALPTGRHTLAAELSGFATARRIFVLPETRNLYIPLTQSTGLLVLTSEPSGAGITVDGTPFGVTPATLHLAAGVHHIVVARGLQHHEEAINVEAGSFLTRSIRW